MGATEFVSRIPNRNWTVPLAISLPRQEVQALAAHLVAVLGTVCIPLSNGSKHFSSASAFTVVIFFL
jgi:hypothetical protein